MVKELWGLHLTAANRYLAIFIFIEKAVWAMVSVLACGVGIVRTRRSSTSLCYRPQKINEILSYIVPVDYLLLSEGSSYAGCMISGMGGRKDKR